jgi:hypothetical protein
MSYGCGKELRRCRYRCAAVCGAAAKISSAPRPSRNPYRRHLQVLLKLCLAPRALAGTGYSKASQIKKPYRQHHIFNRLNPPSLCVSFLPFLIGDAPFHVVSPAAVLLWTARDSESYPAVEAVNRLLKEGICRDTPSQSGGVARFLCSWRGNAFDGSSLEYPSDDGGVGRYSQFC